MIQIIPPKLVHIATIDRCAGNQAGPAHHGNVEGQKELRAEDRQCEPCPYFERYVYLFVTLLLSRARRRLQPSVQRTLRKNQPGIAMLAKNRRAARIYAREISPKQCVVCWRFKIKTGSSGCRRGSKD